MHAQLCRRFSVGASAHTRAHAGARGRALGSETKSQPFCAGGPTWARRLRTANAVALSCPRISSTTGFSYRVGGLPPPTRKRFADRGGQRRAVAVSRTARRRLRVAAGTAAGVAQQSEGVNLRAVGKLTVELGFRHADEFPALKQIVAESRKRQIYDPNLNCCNESRLKAVAEALLLDEHEVVRQMAGSTLRCLPGLGIGELRQVALHFAATNALGLDALFSGVIQEAEQRIQSADGPASTEWKCQCASDIVWSLHRGHVEDERFTAMACSLALESIPSLDIFQLSNLAFRYARANLRAPEVFDAAGRAAIQQLPAVQLVELPRVFLRFEYAAEHCRSVCGEAEAAWWPDLEVQFSAVAKASGASASLKTMEGVADIIVQEGIALDRAWVIELRHAVAGVEGLEAHGIKRLAKSLQTLQWADMCPPALLKRAEAVALKKLQWAAAYRKTGRVKEVHGGPEAVVAADLDAIDNLVVMADTALQFSNCGSTDQALFAAIADAASASRRGVKQPAHIAKAAAKLAAAGVSDDELLEALELRIKQARGRKKTKGCTPEVEDTLEGIEGRGLRLWSDAPLCAVWGLARTLPPPPAPPSLEPGSLRYRDASRPLAIDIGCGFGGYVLGMAGREDRGSLENLNWLGIDTLPQSARRANGIAERWGIQDRTLFVLSDAKKAMQRIEAEYTGPLQVACIQFPTPFQSNKLMSSQNTNRSESDEGDCDDASGPDAIHGKGQYMVEDNLVHHVASALAPGGLLLLQSNVADVAKAMEAQFRLTRCFEPGSVTGSVLTALTQGRTETEAACQRSGREVHRVLLQKIAA